MPFSSVFVNGPYIVQKLTFKNYLETFIMIFSRISYAWPSSVVSSAAGYITRGRLTNRKHLPSSAKVFNREMERQSTVQTIFIVLKSIIIVKNYIFEKKAEISGRKYAIFSGMNLYNH